jgi:hypothetical protein
MKKTSRVLMWVPISIGQVRRSISEEAFQLILEHASE